MVAVERRSRTSGYYGGYRVLECDGRNLDFDRIRMTEGRECGVWVYPRRSSVLGIEWYVNTSITKYEVKDAPV